MGRLSDRVVIVTGAAQGIGAVYARTLAAEGARVSLCDLNPSDAVVAEIESAGGQAIGSVCDITDAAAVADLVAQTAARFGTVHGLVTNAAMFATIKLKPFENIESDEFERVLRVNVRGTFECVKAVAPIMKAQGYGKIVTVASGTVFKGTPMMLSYISSKGAVIAMTRALARELGPSGITVNCLAPGLTMSEAMEAVRDQSTALIQATVASRCLGREQAPSDLAGALGFLLSAESDFMTGQTMVVDGGSVMN